VWIASSSLILLLLTWCLRTAKSRPLPKLDRKDMPRVRRYGEKVHREEIYPHE